MKKIFSLIVLLIAISSSGYAQKINLTDSTFFIDHTDRLTLRIYNSYKHNALSIQKESDRLNLLPNSPNALGLGINYKFIGVSLGFGLPQTDSQKTNYGKTTRFDLQFNVFMKNLSFDSHFQIYKGYYLKNPSDFMEWPHSQSPQLPDMHTISTGAIINYVVNHKRYSNKASVARTQIQVKSAGSLLLGLFVNYDEALSPDGFFPKELPNEIGEDFEINGFRYFATGLSIGYAYNWVISKHFFVNISATPGGGYKHVRVNENNGLSELERHLHGQVQLRGELGYEGKYFFAGFTAYSLIRSINHKAYSLDSATEQYRFFIGKRF